MRTFGVPKTPKGPKMGVLDPFRMHRMVHVSIFLTVTLGIMRTRKRGVFAISGYP